jgi:transcriptional regulator with XRE-family HTH domain
MAITGKRLRQRRIELGKSQHDLANEVSVNQRLISFIENDKSDPVASVVVKLSNTLRVSADWLLGLSENKDLPRRDDTQTENQSEAIRAAHLITRMEDKDKAIALELLYFFDNIKSEHKLSVLELMKAFNVEFGLSKEEQNTLD